MTLVHHQEAVAGIRIFLKIPFMRDAKIRQIHPIRHGMGLGDFALSFLS
jgi:hypothetical protein